MYETSKAAQVENKMHPYDIAVLEIFENRWNGSGCITQATGIQIVTPQFPPGTHLLTAGPGASARTQN